MRCEECHEREATIVFTHVDEDHKKVVHLCPVCAKNHALFDLIEQGTEGDEPMEANDDLGKLPDDDGQADRDATEESTESCPNCGMTFERFRDRYRLGCAVCYTTFREQLRPILRKAHNADAHVGKQMSHSERTAEEMDAWTVTVLERRLQAAIEREEFEQAARLRDKIEEVKQRLPEDE